MFPESSSRVTADGVVGLTRALLAAGVQCVCVSQWPVPAAASKVFTQAFYAALLNGTRASAALTEAMKMVQSSPLFSHPTHWAGEGLIRRHTHTCARTHAHAPMHTHTRECTHKELVYDLFGTPGAGSLEFNQCISIDDCRSLCC